MKKTTTMTHWGCYELEVSNNEVLSIRGIPQDPDPSPIGQSLVGTLNDSARIKQPMVRKSYLEGGVSGALPLRGLEPFVPVSWTEAEELVANELSRVISENGNQAIYGGSYGWASAGRFHHAQSQVHRFLNCAGGYTRSLNTYSLAAGEVILPHVLGESWSLVTKPTSWPNIIEHTELMVAFGGIPLKNAQISGGGMGEHVQSGYMRDAKAKGIEFVNVGPIKSDVADFLDAQWVAAIPNTDVAIMLAIAHVLLVEDLYDREFLERYCVGHERFHRYLLGDADGQSRDAKWAASITGIDADTITSLAYKMASKRMMISVSWSLTRQDHGEQPYWMAVALASMLGQIGLPGGGVGFGYSAENKVGSEQLDIKIGSFPGLPRKIDSFIPVARIADMLLSPGEPFDYDGSQYTYPDIKLIYWAGGNPFHHHQDLNRLAKAWQKPDTVISHDIWWNATARHADIVLPVTSALERNDIGGTSGDAWLQSMPKAVEPSGEAKNDFDIFSAIAKRMGFDELFTHGKDENQWLREIYRQTRENAQKQAIEMPDFDTFWQRGSFTFPKIERSYVMLADFRKDPTKHALNTPSGKIEIYSETIEGFGYDDCPGHPSWLEPAEWLGAKQAKTFPLHLISNQPKTRLHSQLDNGSVSQKTKIKGREPVMVNGEDAQARGIQAGDVVKVYNNRGAMLAGVNISDEILEGTLQIATGAWWNPIAQEGGKAMCVHGNPNVLTMDKGTSNLAQGISALSCLVDMELFQEELPTIDVFRAPAIFNRIDPAAES